MARMAFNISMSRRSGGIQFPSQLMERIIRMRKEVPDRLGDFSFISTRRSQVLAMRYDWRNYSVLCVHNLSAKPREVRLGLGADDERACALVNLLSDSHSHPEQDGTHCVLLEPYGYRWYRVCGAGLFAEAQHHMTRVATLSNRDSDPTMAR
jgi:hypothetical protein